MQLDKWTPLTTLRIIEPRWHDKKVLLSVNKVKAAKTKYLKIVFTQGAMKGDWIMDTKRAKYFKPIETNGVIACYAVPLDELLPLEITKHSLQEIL